MLSVLGQDIVYGKIFPGISVGMFVGCVFYVIQAQLKAAKTGRRDLMAQPFGINTPGMFAFNASIILPVYATTNDKELAFHVGVLCNLLQGLLEIALIPVGPYIAKAIPLVALLGSLASIGIAFLFTEPLQFVMAAPLTGLISWAVLILTFYADITIPYVPKNLLPVIAGTLMAWFTGLASVEKVSDGADPVGFHFPFMHFGFLEHLEKCLPYIGIVFPVALTVTFETLQCRQLAAQAGDDYSVRWSMLGDGFATVVSAFFGCPYGMTIFIGHSAFKEMGACIGYNLMLAVALLIIGCSGLGSLILAIVPVVALQPMVMFVGLAICSDALEATPKQHWPAFMVSLVPAFCNWAIEQCASFAEVICDSAGSECTVNPHAVAGWSEKSSLYGLYLAGQGYLLTSIFFASMFVFVFDKRFFAAAATMIATAICASCGFIHSSQVFLPWKGVPEVDADKDLHWQLTGAYGIIAVLFVACGTAASLKKAPLEFTCGDKDCSSTDERVDAVEVNV
eukprot:TRINITY_DN5963_c0_g1_i2.p1 TRINITY_DN5963_c0_g1~~TRINITY_DN5963_c0_g1_i2.p1  ORF type:complete len:588 (-),score=107.05 TRINITY_DN5963_c0_g1_i2:193-1719(-)